MQLLDIKYEKYKLENGLEVILHQNNDIPLCSVNIWYKTGSANEVISKTGLAHLFEHMMFQGSANVPKEMHFRYIQEAGGTLNASTSFDRTNFYEKIPSNYLELALWLESDRMGFFLPALTQEKLQNQIDVVKNERLERYDNQPYGLAWEIILQSIYDPKHPYGHSTIGTLEDISNFTMEDVIDFYKRYYSPSNAVLVIAGSFDVDNVKKLIDKYFAGIPVLAPHDPIPYKSNFTFRKKCFVREENVQLDRAYLVWKTDKIFSEYDSTLEILSDILSGSKNSRFYRTLVYDKEIAQDITSFQFSGQHDGNFIISTGLKPGKSIDEVNNVIYNIFKEIKKDGIKDKELLKSKNSVRSGFIYSLQSIDQMADQLNYYNFYLDNPNSFIFDLERYSNVNSGNIMDAVEKYFNEDYFDLRIIPGNKELQ